MRIAAAPWMLTLPIFCAVRPKKSAVGVARPVAVPLMVMLAMVARIPGVESTPPMSVSWRPKPSGAEVRLPAMLVSATPAAMLLLSQAAPTKTLPIEASGFRAVRPTL
ncbi:MAG: hypothetical protein QOE70_2988 [Chthoniobacter sp.]|nr:hypothetical protein [Chthoniobacter sp.]